MDKGKFSKNLRSVQSLLDNPSALHSKFFLCWILFGLVVFVAPPGRGAERSLDAQCACSVGQHRALGAISKELLASEKLLAYLGDIYVILRHDRLGDVYVTVRQNLWIPSCVSINNGVLGTSRLARTGSHERKTLMDVCEGGRSGH